MSFKDKISAAVQKARSFITVKNSDYINTKDFTKNYHNMLQDVILALDGVFKGYSDDASSTKTLTGTEVTIIRETALKELTKYLMCGMTENAEDQWWMNYNCGVPAEDASTKFSKKTQKKSTVSIRKTRKSMNADTLLRISAAIQNRTLTVRGVAKKFNVSINTIYYYMDGDGFLKDTGKRLLSKVGENLCYAK